MNETIDYSEHFTIHLLSKNYEAYVKKFDEKSTIENGKINGIPFNKRNGQAIIEDTLGYITCKVMKSLNVGDHIVYFGEIINEEIYEDVEALSTTQLPFKYTKDNLKI